MVLNNQLVETDDKINETAKEVTKIITEDGVFTSGNLQEASYVKETVLDSELSTQVPQNTNAQTFLDINNVIVQDNSLLSLNNGILFKIESAKKPKRANRKGSKSKRRNKAPKGNKNVQKLVIASDIVPSNSLTNKLLQPNSLPLYNGNRTESLGLNVTHPVSNLIEIVPDEEIAPPTLVNIQPSELIEVRTKNGLTALVDVNTLNSSLLLNNEVDAAETQAEESNEVDTQELNIDDLATVITAYKCKLCPYSCNDQKIFLKHYKDAHTQVL